MEKEKMRFVLNLQNFADDEEKKGSDNPSNEEEEKKGDSLAEVIKKQKEMLDNSVSKEEYDKVLKDNQTLKDVVLNGGAYPGQDEEEETIDLEQLGKHIFDTENQDNNLEWVENALKYRKAVLEKHGYDVFAPQVGSMNASEITDNDFAAAEKVADVLQQCVDESDGDPQVFTAKLQSRIMDDSPLRGYKRR